MASVNKMILLGNVGKDPEIRYSASGVAVCNLTVATSRTWKNKDSGDKMEETEWHRVTLYDRLAEIAGEYVKKGKPVFIEGRLKTRKWQDKDGIDRYTTEVIAESLQLLGSKGEGQAPAPRQAAPRTAPAPRSTPAQATGTGFDEMDSDIPW